MKNRFIYSAIVSLISISCFSQQQQLTVSDITPERSVYPCQDRQEALVVIHCPEDFELEFRSNVDRELDVVRMQDGSEKVYNIVFKTKEEGTSFNGRVLYIMAPSFKKVFLPLELEAKMKKEYLISDPYSALRGPFYISLEKGNELFESGMYNQAKDQYYKAQRCPEYLDVDNAIDEYIELCDSMIVWTAIVDSAEAQGDYYCAKDYLSMMVTKNTRCMVLRERYHSIISYYNARCSADMTVGEKYMDDRCYDKAKEVYQNAIAMRNPQMGNAELRLHEIEMVLQKKTYRTRAFFYQYTTDCPIGFMFAGCPPVGSGTGGYFSLSFNKQCIDLVTNANTQFETPTLDYEVGVSLGMTMPIFKSYIHAFFSPISYTGGGYSKVQINEEDASPMDVERMRDQDIHWYNAVSPEVGLIVKYWHVALSYKFQYQYWIGKCDGLKDMLGVTRHSIGIGFAW